MKYLITFMFFISSFLNAQNCSIFKTGNFKTKIDNIEYRVKRTKNKEIGSSRYGTVKHKIKWMSDCKYIMFNRKPKFTKIQTDLKLEKNNTYTDTIYNEIIVISENEFKLITHTENSDLKLEFIYKKI